LASNRLNLNPARKGRRTRRIGFMAFSASRSRPISNAACRRPEYIRTLRISSASVRAAGTRAYRGRPNPSPVPVRR
jgi:hypothetical protein